MEELHMIIVGVLLFSVIVFVISYRIGKSGIVDRGRLATYITLMMWASFLWGLFIMWTSR